MRHKYERLKVVIKKSARNEAGTFIITLSAPASAFQLSDLRKPRTVIEPLDVHLKRAVKGATVNYLSTVEGLVNRLAASPNSGAEIFP